MRVCQFRHFGIGKRQGNARRGDGKQFLFYRLGADCQNPGGVRLAISGRESGDRVIWIFEKIFSIMGGLVIFRSVHGAGCDEAFYVAPEFVTPNPALESETEMRGKRHGIGGGGAGRTAELHGHIRFDEVCLEEAALVLKLPTFIDQRDESDLGRVDAESSSEAQGDAMIHSVQNAGINNQRGLVRPLRDEGNHLQIHGKMSLAFEGDTHRKAKVVLVKLSGGLTVRMRYPRDHESDVSAYRNVLNLPLSMCGRNQRHECNHG
jgi:hypothetical protein